MNYISILDSVPWMAAFVSAGQAVVLYWLTIAFIKLIGIPVVGQTDPQHLWFLLSCTTGMSTGLNRQQTGFWGSIASALALTKTILLVQRIPNTAKFDTW
jgi:hypothetical protein